MPKTISTSCSFRAVLRLSSPRIRTNSTARAATRVKAARWWRKAKKGVIADESGSLGSDSRRTAHPHQVNHDGEAHLVAEKLPTVHQHQADEDQLAQARDGQNQRPTRRIVGAVDQHRSHDRDQRAPVAHHDLSLTRDGSVWTANVPVQPRAACGAESSPDFVDTGL